jgi:hypothetical protein
VHSIYEEPVKNSTKFTKEHFALELEGPSPLETKISGKKPRLSHFTSQQSLRA